MSKQVLSATCLVLLLAGTVLNTAAQTPKATAKTIKHTDTPTKTAAAFGDAEYRLGPEDVLEVFVWNEKELSGPAVVRPDGKITVLPLGEIVASGKTAKEIESEIQTGLEKVLTLPTVNVKVTEINSPKISVFGEVKKPDVYKIKQKTIPHYKQKKKKSKGSKRKQLLLKQPGI